MGKRFRKVSRFAGRHITISNAAKMSRMARDLAMLKFMINVEKKYSDITFSNTVSNTLNPQTLNALSQGTSATTRNGQSVKFTSLFMRAYMTMNASATTTQIRFLIFRDRQPNAAGPGTTTILADNTNILSALQIGNSRRFKILADRIFRLDTNKLNHEFKFFRKLNFHTEYNTTNGGTVADITTNSLYIIMFSDQATNTPTISFYSRVRFVDN